ADRIRQIRAVPLLELRLEIEHVDLRRSAALEQTDHAFGSWREMWQAWKPARRVFGDSLGCQQILIEEMGQGDRAKPHAGMAQEMPPAQDTHVVTAAIHTVTRSRLRRHSISSS